VELSWIAESEKTQLQCWQSWLQVHSAPQQLAQVPLLPKLAGLPARLSLLAMQQPQLDFAQILSPGPQQAAPRQLVEVVRMQ